VLTKEQIVTELSFEKLFTDVKLCDDQLIEFRTKHNLHGNKRNEVYSIIEKDGELFLTDKGSTLAILDDIFELSEPDVIKNVNALLAQHNIQKQGEELVYSLFHDICIKTQILRYLQGINFLFAMRIFYV